MFARFLVSFFDIVSGGNDNFKILLEICFLIGKSISLVANLPPCSAKGIVPLGGIAYGMSYQRKRAFPRKALKTQEEGQDLHAQVLTPLLRRSQETNDYSVQESKQTLSFFLKSPT